MVNNGVYRRDAVYRRQRKNRIFSILVWAIGIAIFAMVLGTTISADLDHHKCVDRQVLAGEDVRTAKYKCHRGLVDEAEYRDSD